MLRLPMVNTLDLVSGLQWNRLGPRLYKEPTLGELQQGVVQQVIIITSIITFIAAAPNRVWINV